jgi:hypothetical protein
VGSNGQFIDSGWQPVIIGSVPAGEPLTLTYAVIPGGSESHATWAYFDSAEEVSAPPVAVFGFSPSEIFEGDPVQFDDASYEFDAGDEIVDWEWEIDGQILDAQNPLYIFAIRVRTDPPDRQAPTVRRPPSCPAKRRATARRSLSWSWATPINGQRTERGSACRPRCADRRALHRPWLARPAQCEPVVGGTPVSGALQEDNNPAYGSGIVNGSRPRQLHRGSVTIDDEDGGSASDGFTFTIVPDDATARAQPRPRRRSVLESDGSYLSYIQSQGDIDVSR